MSEMRGDFEVHLDGAVFYRDSDHSYYDRIEQRGEKWVGPRDARLPSPSTIAKLLETNNEPLLRWAAKQTCNGVAALDKGVPRDGEALWEALRANKLTYADLRNKRAEEGTNVHERILAALAEGGRVPSLASVSDEERGYGQGVLAFWHECEPEPIASEQVVYSAEHRFAGRFDLLCELDSQRTIVDLKTGFVGAGAHAQLAGYALAAEECGLGPIEASAILKVDATGDWELIPCAALESDFIAALRAYHAAKAIGKILRERQKVAA